MDPNYSNYGSYGDYAAGRAINPEAAGAAFAIFGGILLFLLVIFLIIYIYMAICLMKMAHKTNTPNAWLAWIPIANAFLMLQIAKKPLWWFILFLIPFVNIVMTILVWMAIAKVLGKPEWIGVLMIVPVANIIIPGYLAFSNSSTPAPAV
ncbi:MAG TPA: DUF5684 domain-containing protein [Patescibacteria group bacterium]|nr:DUF5684 domain-containing protein [Patescibacteria group bacterium]